MKVIACIDDRGGLTFNGRRQSRDRAVYGDIAKELEGGRLFASEYSRQLFADCDVSLICDENFLDVASDEDTCFVEDRALLPYLSKISRLTLYHWNRHYPADRWLDIDLSREGLRLVETTELEGYSHEKITKEV